LKGETKGLTFCLTLKEGEVSRVVPVSGAYPLISFIPGVLILGEKLTAVKSAGLLCVGTGVFGVEVTG